MEVHGRHSAACPGCRSISRSRHSRYWRSLKDLPVQGTPAILRLRQGCWRCRDAGCERRIFTERLSKVCAPSAQQTKRTRRKVRATLIGDGSMEQTIPYSSNLVNSQALLFTSKQRNFINVLEPIRGNFRDRSRNGADLRTTRPNHGRLRVSPSRHWIQSMLSQKAPINGCRRSGVHLVCGTGPESFTRTASSVKSAARAEASLLFHAS
jgi:zinc-finger of transposase IS204/IS1001/IS1096/IS1165